MIQEVYDKAPFGYIAFTDDGFLYDINETAATWLQYSNDELAGAKIEKIFTLPTRIFFQTHFFPLIRMQEHAEEIFLTLLCRDGKHLPVLLNAKRAGDAVRPITTCAFIVVHHRKKFEDELVAARKAAEAALNENTALLTAKQSLESYTTQLNEQVNLVRRQHEELQQFNHVITHNLKEPLRKMLFYTSMLQEENEPQVMEKLVRASSQMKSVVMSLQQYVWLNEKQNKFEPVKLSDIAGKAADQVREEMPGEILETNFSDLGMVTGDGEQLQLLFYHILQNATKFKRHATTTVTITSTVLKKNELSQLDERYRYMDYLRLEITDDGLGFEPEYADRIFNLFAKLHNREGQGVGLALCRKIVENHHGFISADSKVNAFTRITVLIPYNR